MLQLAKFVFGVTLVGRYIVTAKLGTMLQAYSESTTMLCVVRDRPFNIESLGNVLQGRTLDRRVPGYQVDDRLLRLVELSSQFLVGETLILHASGDGRADWLRFGHWKLCVDMGVDWDSGQEAWHLRKDGQTLLYWCPEYWYPRLS